MIARAHRNRIHSSHWLMLCGMLMLVFLASGRPAFAPPRVQPAVLYFPAAEVTADFAAGKPISSQYHVLAGMHNSPGQAEQHMTQTDVFYVVDGSATFLTGGDMIHPKQTSAGEYRGSGIAGGVPHELKKGDVIIIPKGTPHWFKSVPGVVHYFVVKIDDQKEY